MDSLREGRNDRWTDERLGRYREKMDERGGDKGEQISSVWTR